MAAIASALKVAYENVTGKSDPTATDESFAPWRAAWSGLDLSKQSPAVGALAVSYAVVFGEGFARRMLDENASHTEDKFWRMSMWYGAFDGIDAKRAFGWMLAYSHLSMTVPKPKSK